MAKLDKRTRVGAVTDAVESIESGIKSFDKAIADLPARVQKSYQPLISAQVEVNKLIKEEQDNRDGIYTSLLEGIGLRTKATTLEKARLKVQEAIKSGNEQEKIDAQESLKLLGQTKKLEEELVEDFEGMFPGLVAGVKGLQKGFKVLNMIVSKGPLFLIPTLLIGALAVLVSLVKEANSLSQEFGGGVKANIKISAELKKQTLLAKQFALSAEQVRSSFDAIANAFGDVSVASAQFAVDLARVSRNTGVSAENVANLVSLFNPLTNNSRELSLNMVEVVSNLAQAQGVASGVLIDELASNADLFASFIGKGEKNLIKAAAAAKKVGVEFGSIVELGDGLLDITERINKEQTLSTILGKQISLERFAALNAAGETVAAQEELARILKETQGLTALETRLFAEALGGISVADIQRLTGLRQGGMPVAGGAPQGMFSAFEKKNIEQMDTQTNLLKKINEGVN
jgi:F0F1-type ATP synthase assembly protein I